MPTTKQGWVSKTDGLVVGGYAFCRIVCVCVCVCVCLCMCRERLNVRCVGETFSVYACAEKGCNDEALKCQNTVKYTRVVFSLFYQ